MKNEFIHAVHESFCFLVDDYGFREPYVEDSYGSCTVVYLGQNLGVEISLDLRDRYAGTQLLWLQDGEVPDGYYVSSDGRKRRFPLRSLLQQLSLTGIPSAPKAAKRSQKHSPNHLQITDVISKVERDAKLLASAPNLLRDSNAAFEAAN